MLAAAPPADLAAPTPGRGEALFAVSSLAVWQGESQAGRADAETSVALYRALADKRGEGYALHTLAHTARNHVTERNEYLQSVACLREASGRRLGRSHEKFPAITSIGGVRPDALTDHPSGRALDFPEHASEHLAEMLNHHECWHLAMRAAQAVQHSGFLDAYAKWEAAARSVVQQRGRATGRSREALVKPLPQPSRGVLAIVAAVANEHPAGG